MQSGELVVVKVSPFNAESPTERLQDDLTPTPNFYVRSNFAVPALDARTHRLRVTGAVERQLELNLDDLRSLGGTSLITTMECAGNHRMGLLPLPTGEPWQGGAVSTGRWTGVPLAAVLERAGVRPEAVEILAVGADHGKPKDGPGDIPFARSLPLEKARHADTLLAYSMDDAPLPASHGGPLRLIVPGWYGMAGVKWVSRIEAITEPFTGYYQKGRYVFDYADGAEPTPVTTMRVKSIILTPLDGDTVPPGRVTVRGKAWSGDGDIVRVEVTVDGGDNWQEARLLDAVSPYAWRSWEFDWDAADPGRHALRSRATDTQGNRQPDVARWNRHGYGSNGIRPIAVQVG